MPEAQRIGNNSLKLTPTNGTKSYLRDLGSTIFRDSVQPEQPDVRIHCAGGTVLETSKQYLLLGSLLFRSFFRSECSCVSYLPVVYDIYCPDFDPDVLCKVLESLATGREVIECLSEQETAEVKSILDTFKICIPFLIDNSHDPAFLSNNLIKTEPTEEEESHNNDTFYVDVAMSVDLPSQDCEIEFEPLIEVHETKTEVINPGGGLKQSAANQFCPIRFESQAKADNDFFAFCEKELEKNRKRLKIIDKDSMYKCKLCNSMLGSQRGILGHMAERHFQSQLVEMNRPSVKRCNRCGKGFSNVRGVIVHMTLTHNCLKGLVPEDLTQNFPNFK